MSVILFAHVTWTTWGRLPLIGASELRFLHRFLPATCERHGVELLELGVVSTHLHMVVRLPPTLHIPRLLQSLKGASARAVNRDPEVSKTGLRWARSYDLRSVGPRDLAAAIAYVRSQPRRHPDLAIESNE